jgi:hypothetical protein
MIRQPASRILGYIAKGVGLFLVLGQALVWKAEATDFRIKGTFTFRPVDSGKTMRGDFRMIFSSDCRWFIHIDNLNVDGIKHFELGWDGSFSYSHALLDLPPGGTNENSGVAEIDRREVPREKGNFGNVLWLGCLSSCYLKTNAGKSIHPLWFSPEADANLVKADWELLDKAPYLPSKISYYDAGGVYGPVPGKEWKRAEYSVLETMNIEQFVFPSRFVYIEFRPGKNAKSMDEIEIATRFEGIINGVEIAPYNGDFKPSLGPMTIIDDRRFASSDQPVSLIQYRVKNNFWPEMTNRVVLKEYKAQAKIARLIAAQTETKRVPKWVVYALFGLVVLIPPSILFNNWHKKERS